MLNETIGKEKEAAIPKKKFTFARKVPAAKSKTEVEEVKQTKHTTTIETNDLSIKDINNNHEIRYSESEYKGKENIIIENLDSCTVYLPFIIKSLYVKNITNCKIFAGCISGASFINKAIDC